MLKFGCKNLVCILLLLSWPLFSGAQSSLLTLNSLDVVSINLYDTTGETDVHINSVLVETGLAEITG